MSLSLPFLLVDRYDLAEEIGRGGHAVVYRAHDRVLDRKVAVKVLREDALGVDTLVRFRQEVQVTAQLEHAHILHVYDTGEFEGRPFIVMELASGRTLHERLAREGQLPIVDALQIARDVGLALAHAHSRGVVHRDVKPENILLSSGGAILADFGIARVTTESIARQITSTGTAVGTVQYMSPEQLCAEPNIEARSDQYSLACVLYEMLAGVRPHISATFESLRMLRVSAQHLPVNAHRPRVPNAVSDAILTALSSSPADRFRSMDEFLSAVGVSVSGEFQTVDGSGAGRARGGYGTVQQSARARSASVARRAIERESVATSRARQWPLASIAVGALAVVLVVFFQQRPRVGSVTSIDDGKLDVVLVEGPESADAASASASARVRAALRAELTSWDALRLVTEGSVSASAVKITPRITAIADSFRIQLDLAASNVRNAAPISSMISASELSAPANVVSSMVRQALVLYVAPSPMMIADVPGLDALPGRSLPALKAYVSGFAALRHGRPDSAAREFRDAVRVAPQFAQAEFWAAQSSAWASPYDVGSWRANAENAARASLHGVDSLLADALRHMALAEFPDACAAYRAATIRDPHSFTAWYGLGECQRLDSLVINRPQGSRFRSSHWSALDAYKRAVENAPTSAWLGALYAPILRTTYARAGDARGGHTGGARRDTMFALPYLDADTIAFDPVSLAEGGSMGRRSVPLLLTGALRRGRVVARDLTSRWIRQFPDAPEGWFQHAVALELSGQIVSKGDGSSADEALDRVEASVSSTAMRARIGVARTRLALRRGDVKGAVALARAALGTSLQLTPDVQFILAPLAALVGDVSLATRLAGKGRESNAALAPVVADSLRAFSLRAMLGSCEGLDITRQSLERLFRSSITSTELQAMRDTWLLPAYRLAAPCLGRTALSGLTPVTPFDFAYQALAAQNDGEARRRLADLRATRVGATFATISWDYLFAESWALVQAGDTAAARMQLVGALDDIGSMGMYTLDEMAQAAGFRRGLLLLADISREGRSSRDSESEWVQRASELTSTISQERKR